MVAHFCISQAFIGKRQTILWFILVIFCTQFVRTMSSSTEDYLDTGALGTEMSLSTPAPVTAYSSSSSLMVLSISLAICLPNAWTLVTLGRTRLLKTKSNIYVASLALSDLLLGTILAVYHMGMLLGYESDFAENKMACVVFTGFSCLCVVASIMMSTLIAVDRYMYISHPFVYQRVATLHKVRLSVVGVFVLAFITGFLLGMIKYLDENIACPDNLAVKADVYIVAPAYITCCLVAGTMYGLISTVALRHLKKTQFERSFLPRTIPSGYIGELQTRSVPPSMSNDETTRQCFKTEADTHGNDKGQVEKTDSLRGLPVPVPQRKSDKDFEQSISPEVASTQANFNGGWGENIFVDDQMPSTSQSTSDRKDHEHICLTTQSQPEKDHPGIQVCDVTDQENTNKRLGQETDAQHRLQASDSPQKHTSVETLSPLRENPGKEAYSSNQQLPVLSELQQNAIAQFVPRESCSLRHPVMNEKPQSHICFALKSRTNKDHSKDVCSGPQLMLQGRPGGRDCSENAHVVNERIAEEPTCAICWSKPNNEYQEQIFSAHMFQPNRDHNGQSNIKQTHSGRISHGENQRSQSDNGHSILCANGIHTGQTNFAHITVVPVSKTFDNHCEHPRQIHAKPSGNCTAQTILSHTLSVTTGNHNCGGNFVLSKTSSNGNHTNGSNTGQTYSAPTQNSNSSQNRQGYLGVTPAPDVQRAGQYDTASHRHAENIGYTSQRPRYSNNASDQVMLRLRAVKMFVVVFGVFFLCYTPFITVHAMRRLWDSGSVSLENACRFLVLLNSALNVPIYLLLNTDFRKAFLSLCRRCTVEPET